MAGLSWIYTTVIIIVTGINNSALLEIVVSISANSPQIEVMRLVKDAGKDVTPSASKEDSIVITTNH